RRRHTRSKRDWSSDVCSSDLGSAILLKFASSHAVPFKLPEPGTPPISIETLALAVWGGLFHVTTAVFVSVVPAGSPEAICTRNRSEERRVGKEVRRWCSWVY